MQAIRDAFRRHTLKSPASRLLQKPGVRPTLSRNARPPGGAVMNVAYSNLEFSAIPDIGSRQAAKPALRATEIQISWDFAARSAAIHGDTICHAGTARPAAHAAGNALIVALRVSAGTKRSENNLGAKYRLLSIQIDPVCDDFQTAEFLTADYA